MAGGLRCLFGITAAAWLLSVAVMEMDAPSDPCDLGDIFTDVTQIRESHGRLGNYKKKKKKSSNHVLRFSLK